MSLVLELFLKDVQEFLVQATYDGRGDSGAVGLVAADDFNQEPIEVHLNTYVVVAFCLSEPHKIYP